MFPFDDVIMWFGTDRQQAVVWVHIGPDLCHIMASLDHNELRLIGHFYFVKAEKVMYDTYIKLMIKVNKEDYQIIDQAIRRYRV